MRQANGPRFLWIGRTLGALLVAWGLAIYLERAQARGESAGRTALGLLELLAIWAAFMAAIWLAGFLLRRVRPG